MAYNPTIALNPTLAYNPPPTGRIFPRIPLNFAWIFLGFAGLFSIFTNPKKNQDRDSDPPPSVKLVRWGSAWPGPKGVAIKSHGFGRPHYYLVTSGPECPEFPTSALQTFVGGLVLGTPGILPIPIANVYPERGNLDEKTW